MWLGWNSRYIPAVAGARDNKGMSVRILVVDDHLVVRSGIRTLLGRHPDWEVIDEAEDGFQAVEKANRLKPDVVVLDLSMPENERFGSVSEDP